MTMLIRAIGAASVLAIAAAIMLRIGDWASVDGRRIPLAVLGWLCCFPLIIFGWQMVTP